MSGRGPLWTRARLERVMRLRFGVTSRGTVDTAAAAEAMGVSRRTVQRWLHARHGRSIAHIPKARLEQLIALLLPSPDTLEREAQVARNATRAIEQLTAPKGLGLRPAWERQQWHKEHVVAVIDIKDHAIRQIATARADEVRRRELARRGRIVDEVIVPTRFHATLLTHQVLTELRPWRFEAARSQVAQGFTQAWTADAPRTDLSRTLADLLSTGRDVTDR